MTMDLRMLASFKPIRDSGVDDKCQFKDVHGDYGLTTFRDSIDWAEWIRYSEDRMAYYYRLYDKYLNEEMLPTEWILFLDRIMTVLKCYNDRLVLELREIRDKKFDEYHSIFFDNINNQYLTKMDVAELFRDASTLAQMVIAYIKKCNGYDFIKTRYPMHFCQLIFFYHNHNWIIIS